MQQKNNFFVWVIATSVVFIIGFGYLIYRTGAYRLVTHKLETTKVILYTVKVQVKADEQSLARVTPYRNDQLGHLDETLRKRIDKEGAKVEAGTVNVKEGIISYVINEVPDTGNLFRLLTIPGKLEFFSTFETSEVISYLSEANTQLRKILAKEKVKKGKETPGVSVGDQLFGDMVPDSVRQRKTLEEEEKMYENPLYNVLYPNINTAGGVNTSVGEGPMIGRAFDKDTAEINRLLAYEEVKTIFPRSVELMWSAAPVTKTSEGKDVFGLYAIDHPYQLPAPLTGESVTDAYQSYDANGLPEVDISMNVGGSSIWQRMTEQASSAAPVKKCIAIVIDGKVFSAPRVQQQISGGRTQITGIQDLKEAQNLANMITSGELEVPVTAAVISVTKTKGLHF